MNTNQRVSSFDKRRDGGFTMVEAIVAFVVLAAGLLALLSFHGATQRTNSEAKIQAEAVALAEEKLQELESFLAYDDGRLEAGEDSDTPPGSGLASFSRSWEVEDRDPIPCVLEEEVVESCLKRATVEVTWFDRNGDQQRVEVSSNIRYRNPVADAGRFLEVVSNQLAVVDGGGGGDASWGDGNPGQEPEPEPEPEPGPDPEPESEPEPETPAPVIASCGCYFQGNKYSLTSSGGACCSVSGCQSSNSSPRNKQSWTYSCTVSN